MGLCTVMGLTLSTQASAAPEGNSVNAVQQAKRVTGTVSDSQGPLIGATILEKGTTNGVVTDFVKKCKSFFGLHSFPVCG